MKIGVDFSIKSPALTARNKDGSLSFYSFPRRSVVKEDTIIALKNSGVEVHVLDDETPLPKRATIAERERSSLTDAIMLISSISEKVNTLRIQDHTGMIVDYDTPLYVAIEGFSFGSTGNRLAQLSGYQWTLRFFLYSQNKMHPKNFFTYSPMTVKATAGKGNYKKEQMIEAFMNSNDEVLRNTTFWQSITQDPSQFQTKKGNWLKPIDDVIDSYWVLMTMENDVEELLKEKGI
jgi:hypothetical protein